MLIEKILMVLCYRTFFYLLIIFIYVIKYIVQRSDRVSPFVMGRLRSPPAVRRRVRFWHHFYNFNLKVNVYTKHNQKMLTIRPPASVQRVVFIITIIISFINPFLSIKPINFFCRLNFIFYNQTILPSEHYYTNDNIMNNVLQFVVLYIFSFFVVSIYFMTYKFIYLNSILNCFIGLNHRKKC